MRYLVLALLLPLAACHKNVAVTPDLLGSASSDPAFDAAEAARLAAERAAAVAALRENFQRVYFETNSSVLGSDARSALGENAELLGHNEGLRVEVQGHADDRGTTEFNVALGQRRAASVVSFLNGQGVDGKRLLAVSYGEELPVASGVSESAWAANRRVEFRITWGGSDSVTGTVL